MSLKHIAYLQPTERFTMNSCNLCNVSSLNLLFCTMLFIQCGADRVIENQDATLIALDTPLWNEEQQSVDLLYTLRDEEGDDQKIRVEVCHDDGTQCGFPIEGRGSDGTIHIPTMRFSQDTQHLFRWDIGCGRIVGDQIQETSLSQDYQIRILIRGTGSTLQTETFRLDDNPSATSLPTCSRAS